MKLLFATTAVLCLTAFASAAETKPYVSSTFQDILKRVVEREPESKAIISVKEKSKSDIVVNFDFEIKRSKENPNQVFISLSQLGMNGRKIDESYLLIPDVAMLQELSNQQKLVELKVKRQKQLETESAKRIFDLTNGQLKRGMTLEDVISLWGKPEPVVPASPPDHGAIISLPTTQGANIASPSLTYPNVVLTFEWIFDGWTATLPLIDAQKRSK